MNTPNCEIGRKNFKAEAIVIHGTEGSTESAINWCMNHESKVSYHYIIGANLKIYELVNPQNTAWHAGKIFKSTWKLLKPNTNPNYYTIGIAYAGFAEKGPSYRQAVLMIDLIRHLTKLYTIEMDTLHIIGHNEIRADKICPGVRLSARAISEMTRLS